MRVAVKLYLVSYQRPGVLNASDGYENSQTQESTERLGASGERCSRRYRCSRQARSGSTHLLLVEVFCLFILAAGHGRLDQQTPERYYDHGETSIAHG
jgi:hypothetical protein